MRVVLSECWSLVFLVLFGRSRGLANLTEKACVDAFTEYNFVPSDFDRYPEVFGATGFLRLPAAGTYVGPDSIIEYISFGTSLTPFTKSLTPITPSPNIFHFKSVVHNGTACQFRYYDSTRYETDERNAVGFEFNVGNLRKLTFDYDTKKVLSIDLYFKPAFLKFYLGVAFDTDRTRSAVCNIMIQQCPDIYSNMTLNECMAKMSELPPYSTGVDSDINFDGNDFSCRVVHSFMTTFNDFHCPHLSFLPLPDAAGNVKCQTSKYESPEAYMDADDLETFDSFLLSEESQVGSLDGYRILSSELDTAVPTSEPTLSPTKASAARAVGAHHGLWVSFPFLLLLTGQHVHH